MPSTQFPAINRHVAPFDGALFAVFTTGAAADVDGLVGAVGMRAYFGGRDVCGGFVCVGIHCVHGGVRLL